MGILKGLINRQAAVGLIALCSVGLLLRIWHLGTPSLWIDEGYTVNAAHAVLQHGYPLLDSGDFYDNGILTTYIVAGVIGAFGLDPFLPWTARLPAVLAGVGCIIAVYVVTRTMLGSRAIAVGSASLVTFSSWYVAWSRQARGYTMLSFFLLLAAFFFWQFLEHGRRRDLVWSGFAFLGAYASHGLALVWLPAFAFLWLAHFGLNRKWTYRRIALYGALAVAVTVIGLTVAVHTSRLAAYGFMDAYASFLITDLWPLAVGSAAGILLGLFDRNRTWPMAFLAACLLLPLVIIAGFSPVLQFRYLFPLVPFMAILTTYAAYRAGELVFANRSRIVRNALSAIALVAVSFPLLAFVPKGHYPLEFGSPQPDFRTVFSLIARERTAEDIIVSAHPVLHRIYLDTDGVWLPMSLTGKPSEIEYWVGKGHDPYVAAPVLDDTELTAILETGHGFVIIDAMTRVRLPSVVARLEQHPRVRMIFSEATSNLNSIWLYRF